MILPRNITNSRKSERWGRIETIETLRDDDELVRRKGWVGCGGEGKKSGPCGRSSARVSNARLLEMNNGRVISLIRRCKTCPRCTRGAQTTSRHVLPDIGDGSMTDKTIKAPKSGRETPKPLINNLFLLVNVARCRRCCCCFVPPVHTYYHYGNSMYYSNREYHGTQKQ